MSARTCFCGCGEALEGAPQSRYRPGHRQRAYRARLAARPPSPPAATSSPSLALVEQVGRVAASFLALRQQGTIGLHGRIAPRLELVDLVQAEIARLVELAGGRPAPAASSVTPAELVGLRERAEDLLRWPALEAGVVLVPRDQLEALLEAVRALLPPPTPAR